MFKLSLGLDQVDSTEFRNGYFISSVCNRKNTSMYLIPRFELLDDTTRLGMIMDRLGDINTMQSICLSGCRYSSAASLLAFSLGSTTPVDRVLSFIILCVEKSVVRQQRLSTLTFDQLKRLIFHDFSLQTSWWFFINDVHD